MLEFQPRYDWQPIIKIGFNNFVQKKTKNNIKNKIKLKINPEKTLLFYVKLKKSFTTFPAEKILF